MSQTSPVEQPQALSPTKPEKSEASHQDQSAAERRRLRRMSILGVVAVVLIGLNLRAGISSAAALFHDMQLFLGYGPFVAALLPSIPTLVFAVAGATTSGVVRRMGIERTILLALALLTAGLAVRGIPSVGVLMLGTVLAMCGLALCNVTMPSFIRQNYSHKTSTMTGVYTITMSIGATAASSLSVPLARQLDSPLLGLAAWSILGVVGILVFLPIVLSAKRQTTSTDQERVSPWALLKTSKGLMITGFFLAQALFVYAIISWLSIILISRGMTPEAAGVMLGLMQIVSVPASILLLTLANRPGRLRTAMNICALAAMAGVLCLLYLPLSLAFIGPVLIGIQFAVFPLILVVISRSGKNAAETTAMSTISQSLGYLFSTIGPFGMGLLYAATNGWTLSLWLLAGVAFLQLLLGIGLTPKFPGRKTA
ncbi:CynX/NimT family MFS transporter [Paeniglutamicibacter cryotolerans]|uniref:CP family cyanate transporter-like MFS transporter n=1 Tax=Paeniglutamicibacter cryotolerans TaxID=670079 RepID=A0A839QEX8_9MICC|nr:MFS transporter [Paeniglutamicibacter cryotolerans]MBB2994699.1 CP family cyanate transporter-like MFS transporter [Paeniglutamicibacter cryotolerans]